MKTGDLVKVFTAGGEPEKNLAIIIANDPSGWFWIKWEGKLQIWPSECMEKA